MLLTYYSCLGLMLLTYYYCLGLMLLTFYYCLGLMLLTYYYWSLGSSQGALCTRLEAELANIAIEKR